MVLPTGPPVSAMSHQQFMPTVNVQWNGVAITSLCHAIRITSHTTVTRFMHTVNIHRNSAAIRHHSSLLHISPTFHAHSEMLPAPGSIGHCHLSQCFTHTVTVHQHVAIKYHRSLPCQQESVTAISRYSHNVSSTQWMSTEMVLPSDITSLCHVWCTQWISTGMVLSRGTISHCCASPVWRTQWISTETVLTSEITNHYVSQSLRLKHTVNIQ